MLTEDENEANDIRHPDGSIKPEGLNPSFKLEEIVVDEVPTDPRKPVPSDKQSVGRFIDKDIWESAREDYEVTGLSLNEIEEKYGISKQALYKRRKRHDWKPKGHAPWEEIARAHLYGYLEAVTGLQELGYMSHQDVKDLTHLQELSLIHI